MINSFRVKQFILKIRRLVHKFLVLAVWKLFYVSRFAFLIRDVFFSRNATLTTLHAGILRCHNSTILYGFFMRKVFTSIHDWSARTMDLARTNFLKEAKISFIFNFIFQLFNRFVLTYYNFICIQNSSFVNSALMQMYFFDKLSAVYNAILVRIETPLLTNSFSLRFLFRGDGFFFSSVKLNYLSLDTIDPLPLVEFTGLFLFASIMSNMFISWQTVFMGNSMLDLHVNYSFVGLFESKGYLMWFVRPRFIFKARLYRYWLTREIGYSSPLRGAQKALRTWKFFYRGPRKIARSTRFDANAFRYRFFSKFYKISKFSALRSKEFGNFGFIWTTMLN